MCDIVGAGTKLSVGAGRLTRTEIKAEEVNKHVIYRFLYHLHGCGGVLLHLPRHVVLPCDFYGDGRAVLHGSCDLSVELCQGQVL